MKIIVYAKYFMELDSTRKTFARYEINLSKGEIKEDLLLDNPLFKRLMTAVRREIKKPITTRMPEYRGEVVCQTLATIKPDLKNQKFVSAFFNDAVSQIDNNMFCELVTEK